MFLEKSVYVLQKYILERSSRFVVRGFRFRWERPFPQKGSHDDARSQRYRHFTWRIELWLRSRSDFRVAIGQVGRIPAALTPASPKRFFIALSRGELANSPLSLFVFLRKLSSYLPRSTAFVSYPLSSGTLDDIAASDLQRSPYRSFAFARMRRIPFCTQKPLTEKIFNKRASPHCGPAAINRQ